MKVIWAPMYDNGNAREEGVDALWEECKAACRKDMVVLINCFQSFYAGPMLLAAMMIRAGVDKKRAFEHIGARRNIYGGHFLEPSMYPDTAFINIINKAEGLIRAHRFLDGLQPDRGLQPQRSSSAAAPKPPPPRLQPEGIAIPSPPKQPPNPLPSRYSREAQMERPALKRSYTRQREAQMERPAPYRPLPTPPTAPQAPAEPEPTPAPKPAPQAAPEHGLEPKSSLKSGPGAAQEPEAAAACSQKIKKQKIKNKKNKEDRGSPKEQKGEKVYGDHAEVPDVPDDPDEKSPAWTDEEEHEIWRGMSIEERCKHVSSIKRQLSWLAEHDGANIERGLQPAARHENLSDDIKTWLGEYNLRQHPPRKD
jgi:hypothetical protein